jgi:hypothetical protein
MFCAEVMTAGGILLVIFVPLVVNHKLTVLLLGCGLVAVGMILVYKETMK